MEVCACKCCCQWKPEEGAVTSGCKLLMLLTAELSPAPQISFFYMLLTRTQSILQFFVFFFLCVIQQVREKETHELFCYTRHFTSGSLVWIDLVWLYLILSANPLSYLQRKISRHQRRPCGSDKAGFRASLCSWRPSS